MLLLFYLVLAANEFDVGYILDIYVKMGFCVALLALVQAVSFIFGFERGYDFSWFIPWYRTDVSDLGALRVRSIFPEPAVFGATLAPVLFVAVTNLTRRRRVSVGFFASLAIVLAAALTFSAVTYVALMLSAILVALRRRSRLGSIGIAVGLMVGTAAYVYLPDIRVRVDDLLALYTSEGIASANFSSLALHNNAIVAREHLLATGFLGGGLGSHPIAFARYSLLFGHSEVPIVQVYLNAGDASSLLLRIMSELGAPGLLLLAVFLVWFRAPAEEEEDQKSASKQYMPSNRLVSDASLVFLSVALLRNGHYFAYGLPLFILLYCYAHRASSAQRATADPTSPVWQIRSSAAA